MKDLEKIKTLLKMIECITNISSLEEGLPSEYICADVEALLLKHIKNDLFTELEKAYKKVK